MDCMYPTRYIHGTIQAGILEWVAMPFSRRSSRPRDQTRVLFLVCGSCGAGKYLTAEPPLFKISFLRGVKNQVQQQSLEPENKGGSGNTEWICEKLRWKDVGETDSRSRPLKFLHSCTSAGDVRVFKPKLCFSREERRTASKSVRAPPSLSPTHSLSSLPPWTSCVWRRDACVAVA